MGIFAFIIWNGSPEIFTLGPVTLRWYGLLFAGGFLVSQQILYYIHRQEGKPEKDVDTLTIYMVIATILGARLGHVIFYQPEIIWQDPLSILLPFEFTPSFRFTGLQGLASHGGAIGILFALWLYSRKKKPGQNYLQVLDRIVILVALTGAFIRLGNFFNSEILGKPTDAPTAVVFINPVTSSLQGDRERSSIESITVERNKESAEQPNGRVPVKLFLFFKPGIKEVEALSYTRSTVRSTLFGASEYIDEQGAQFGGYQTITDEKTNQVMARVQTLAIARHPAQMYECISCVLLFAFLFSIWRRHKINLPEGRIFGFFMIILWGLRFFYEFLKENQVAFEEELPINMGQILSIPLVIIGIFILIRSYRRPEPQA